MKALLIGTPSSCQEGYFLTNYLVTCFNGMFTDSSKRSGFTLVDYCLLIQKDRTHCKCPMPASLIKSSNPIKELYRWSVVGCVIQATGTVVYEDGLRLTMPWRMKKVQICVRTKHPKPVEEQKIWSAQLDMINV